MSEIKPALTAEGWRRGVTPDGAAGIRTDGTIWLAPEADETYAPHALAALCLHGQPFGFTREDVRMLRAATILYTTGSLTAALNLADRIEALLPLDAP